MGDENDAEMTDAEHEEMYRTLVDMSEDDLRERLAEMRRRLLPIKTE